MSVGTIDVRPAGMGDGESETVASEPEGEGGEATDGEASGAVEAVLTRLGAGTANVVDCTGSDEAGTRAGSSLCERRLMARSTALLAASTCSARSSC